MTPTPISPTLKRLGLTQIEAARITGISHHALSRYVRGVLVTPRWLVLLLNAWELCPEALAAARAIAPTSTTPPKTPTSPASTASKPTPAGPETLASGLLPKEPPRYQPHQPAGTDPKQDLPSFGQSTFQHPQRGPFERGPC